MSSNYAPDFYGIDTPSHEELIASSKNIKEMAKIIGVNSLFFLSLDGTYKAMGYRKGMLNLLNLQTTVSQENILLNS